MFSHIHLLFFRHFLSHKCQLNTSIFCTFRQLKGNPFAWLLFYSLLCRWISFQGLICCNVCVNNARWEGLKIAYRLIWALMIGNLLNLFCWLLWDIFLRKQSLYCTLLMMDDAFFVFNLLQNIQTSLISRLYFQWLINLPMHHQ